MKFFLRVFACMLAMQSLQVVAEGDPATGQTKAAICAACHGADGNSMVPQWPKLAGQHQEYLARQTNLIKAGARPVPEMAGIVVSIDEQDIGDIAAWYSSQTIKGGVAEESLAEAGQKLWRAGNAISGVPACSACHGPSGEGNPLAGYPALAGQHAVYTTSMLKRFRGGENWGEKDGNSQVMNGVAAALSDEDIGAVASFIQGLYRVEN